MRFLQIQLFEYTCMIYLIGSGMWATNNSVVAVDVVGKETHASRKPVIR